MTSSAGGCGLLLVVSDSTWKQCGKVEVLYIEDLCDLDLGPNSQTILGQS